MPLKFFLGAQVVHQLRLAIPRMAREHEQRTLVLRHQRMSHATDDLQDGFSANHPTRDLGGGPS